MGWFARISIANRWVTILIALAIIGGSIFGTLQLKTELIPDIELPFIVVFGATEGQSPEDLRDNISIPVEEEVMKVPGYKHIESTSLENYCFVFATFEYGTDMEETEEAVQQRLRANSYLQSLLDSEVMTNSLVVTRISFEMMPLVWVTLSSDEKTSAEVRTVAEDLADFASVEGILTEETLFAKPVTIEGGEEDVLVIPDAYAMNNLGVPLSWLVLALEGQAEYQSLDDIRSASLLNPDITIDDVADVVNPVSISYTNGKHSVSVMWMKDPKANTVDVANAITSKISEFQATEGYPDDIIVTVVMDQSDFIEQSVNDLARDAIIGLVLAAIVVFLFLLAFRASLIIVVSIPFSIMVAFLLMWVFDITINILTLSGLAIAVGRVVDDSIVSLENIYRHLQRGESFGQAAVDGIKEIAMPVISATVATVAIFIPLILVGGLVGEMFRPFGLTVAFALMASLVAALILVPPLSSFMGGKKVSFEGSDNWYTRLYTRALRWSLGHRAITLLITIAIFIGSMFISYYYVGTSFIDQGGEKMITVEISMPGGNDQDLKRKVDEVEQKVEELDKVVNYYSYLGSFMGGTLESGIATLYVELTSDANLEQLTDLLRQKCEQINDTQSTIKVTAGGVEQEMMGGSGLEVRVIGTEDGDLEPVQEVTTTLTEMIQELELSGDLGNLESELVTKQTNVSKEWTEIGLGQYISATDLDVTTAGQLLEAQWYAMRFGWPYIQLGHTPSTVIVDGNTTGISMPGIVMSLSDLDSIKELHVVAASEANPLGTMQLGDLADVEWDPAEFRRAEGGYAGTITAAITTDDVGAVNAKVQEMIDDLKQQGLPEGVSDIKMGGVAEQMMEGFTDMFIAIGIAILIVFAVLVISFRSWLTPLLIMVSMPLASIGAVLALLITGKTLGMSGMMGVLMLVGIVLTNAIVLLTFVDDRRKEGYSVHDALMDAGRIRLRPILMTALTTMIALVPLAIGFGEGVLMAAELGVVVIGGLFSSTLLTLVVVPVLYSLTERFRRRAPSRSD